MKGLILEVKQSMGDSIITDIIKELHLLTHVGFN